MAVLYVEAGLDRPAKLTMCRILEVHYWACGRVEWSSRISAENSERWRVRNMEDSVEQRKVALNRRASEGVHDHDRLTAPVQRGGKIGRLLDEPGRVGEYVARTSAPSKREA